MGRVTRKKVYDSPNDVIPKVATPSRKRIARNSRRISPSPTIIPKTHARRVTPKKTTPSVSRSYSPYPDDGFPLSQAPCVVGWDSHNDISFDGTNIRISDILKDLKNDPKETCDVERMPSTPPLLIETCRSSNPPVQLHGRTTRVSRRQTRAKRPGVDGNDLLLKLQAAIQDSTLNDKTEESTRRIITRSQVAEETPSKAKDNGSSKDVATSTTRDGETVKDDAAECSESPTSKQMGQSLLKQMEESFDLFQTPAPVIPTVKANPRTTPKADGSSDDLWTDDDMFNDSFVNATQAMVDNGGFISPKCPPPKRQLCRTPEARSNKRFTFSLDNTVVGATDKVSSIQSGANTTAKSTVTDSRQTKVTTTISIPPSNESGKDVKLETCVTSQNSTGGVSLNVSAINTRSLKNGQRPLVSSSTSTSTSVPFQSYQAHKAAVDTDGNRSLSLSQVPPTQQTASKFRFQRHSSMPVVGSTHHAHPGTRPSITHPVSTHQGVAGIGIAIQAPRNSIQSQQACTRPQPPAYRHSASRFRQPEQKFRQPNPPPRQPNPPPRQPNPPSRQPNPPPRLPNPPPRQPNPPSRQPNPRFRHQPPGFRAAQPRIVQPVEPNRLQVPRNIRPEQSVSKSSHGVTNQPSMAGDLSFVWSSSQFAATSTQIHDDVNKEKPGSVVNPTKTPALTRNTVILNAVSNPHTASVQSTARSFVKPDAIPVNTRSVMKSPKTVNVPNPEANMDMSISDDLLATLAEPDELLDTQACLALVDSPLKNNLASSQASTTVWSDFEVDVENDCMTAAAKVRDLPASSMELDHLDCFLLEPKRTKSVPKVKRKESIAVPAVESDGFDVDDDLDPEVLSILDQVELRASQEMKKDATKQKHPENQSVCSTSKPLVQNSVKSHGAVFKPPTSQLLNNKKSLAVVTQSTSQVPHHHPVSAVTKPQAVMTTERKSVISGPTIGNEARSFLGGSRPSAQQNIGKQSVPLKKSPILNNAKDVSTMAVMTTERKSVLSGPAIGNEGRSLPGGSRPSVQQNIGKQAIPLKSPILNNTKDISAIAKHVPNSSCLKSSSSFSSGSGSRAQTSVSTVTSAGVSCVPPTVNQPPSFTPGNLTNNMPKTSTDNKPTVSDTVNAMKMTDNPCTVPEDSAMVISPFKCSPDEIEKKRLLALQKRQNRLKLSKKLNK